ncbi:hypothetical protein H5410_027770, partial [Solanum commersonii]
SVEGQSRRTFGELRHIAKSYKIKLTNLWKLRFFTLHFKIKPAAPDNKTKYLHYEIKVRPILPMPSGYSDFPRFGQNWSLEHLLPLRMMSTTPSLGEIQNLAQSGVTQASPHKTQHNFITTQQLRLDFKQAQQGIHD